MRNTDESVGGYNNNNIIMVFSLSPNIITQQLLQSSRFCLVPRKATEFRRADVFCGGAGYPRRIRMTETDR